MKVIVLRIPEKKCRLNNFNISIFSIFLIIDVRDIMLKYKKLENNI